MLKIRAAATLVATTLLYTTSAFAQHPANIPISDLKAAYERADPLPIASKELVELGRLLFWDPRVSSSGKTACVTCHLPYLGWAATDLRSRSDSGRSTSRKSQPVMGLAHAEGNPYGWDGRSATLEAQIISSVSTGSMSMHNTDAPVKVEVIETRIRAIPDYVDRFNRALPGTDITLASMAKAIAAYEKTIEPGIAPFDRWVKGDESAISESAKRGFVLFNTKANCAACHSTWRFTDDSFHDIGTATKDLGRGQQVKNDPKMQYAFKTPTLRSVALRPPYMHDGSSATLYDVMKHYEKGGIDRPSRSREIFPLKLSDQERLDLVAFMQTLTGVPEGERAPVLPAAAKTD